MATTKAAADTPLGQMSMTDLQIFRKVANPGVTDVSQANRETLDAYARKHPEQKVYGRVFIAPQSSGSTDPQSVVLTVGTSDALDRLPTQLSEQSRTPMAPASAMLNHGLPPMGPLAPSAYRQYGNAQQAGPAAAAVPPRPSPLALLGYHPPSPPRPAQAPPAQVGAAMYPSTPVRTPSQFERMIQAQLHQNRSPPQPSQQPPQQSMFPGPPPRSQQGAAPQAPAATPASSPMPWMLGARAPAAVPLPDMSTQYSQFPHQEAEPAAAGSPSQQQQHQAPHTEEPPQQQQQHYEQQQQQQYPPEEQQQQGPSNPFQPPPSGAPAPGAGGGSSAAYLETDPSIVTQKQIAMLELQKLELRKKVLTKKFTMEDTLSSMLTEIEGQEANENMMTITSNLIQLGKIVPFGLVMLNQKFPILRIDQDWAEEFTQAENLDKLQMPVAKIYKRFLRRAAVNPFFEIAMLFIMSIVVWDLRARFVGRGFEKRRADADPEPDLAPPPMDNHPMDGEDGGLGDDQEPLNVPMQDMSPPPKDDGVIPPNTGMYTFMNIVNPSPRAQPDANNNQPD